MSDEAIIEEVSCQRCGAKCGQPCRSARYGEGMDFNTPHGRPCDPHQVRVWRWLAFEDRPRWSCTKPGCTGSRKAISAGEMGSSTEGGCSDCDWWINDPAHTITLDELLRDLNADALAMHELIRNPDAPHRNIEMEANSPPPFLLVPRTKPPEFNPLRSSVEGET